MKKILLTFLILIISLNGFSQKKTKQVVAPVSKQPDTLNTTLYKGLKWRNIGPFRGGRSVTSSGVIGNPLLYYMGSTGGGIWKTEDAGITWKNISDGYFKTGSVGAIAVAESDPNVLYVGMGEHAVRGVMTSHGDGIYKSTDAGKTWQNIGLNKTKHIAAVRIHPQNPDVVLVAAQGAVHGPSEDRGIYKTIDGGKTWKKVLYVNENTGACDLSMDMANPRILYAGFWEHQRMAWQVKSGGPGSALYKSSDGGETWTKLTEGLPKVMGKVAISVSRANPNRVYANIEAEGDKGGIFRSDDAGKTWNQTSKARVTVARAWYYIEIEADPQNPDWVYCINAPLLKSIDGGRTFSPINVLHGDNHSIWINPQNNKNFINSNDGGANITFNGGQSFSTEGNQPTAQFYRVITDKRFPYYVYGGQQDNSTVAIASRTGGYGIDTRDWYTVAGGESAFIAFDPTNPELVYGGSYHSNLEVWDAKTDKTRDVMEHPVGGLAMKPKNMKYRFNWNSPLISSPQNPKVMYHGGNVVFRTNNGGSSWEVISPDLTRNDKTKQEDGGAPFTNEGAGGEVYNSLAYLIASPHQYGVLWAGSDCGLVHITQDDGKTWQNVTPPNLEECLINSIEVSPHEPETAYIVATRYKFNDLTPQIYVTKDFGKSWKKITNGIGNEDFVRVVREDPVRKGLLYCGAETGFYISYNEGEQWSKFQLNLPVVPINDLGFRDNDLIAATAGRAFWILDDLGVLQQSDGALGNKSVLFRSKPSVRFEGGYSPEPSTTVGQNPMNGVILSYFLTKDMDSSKVILQVLDEKGKIIRTYDNQKDPSFQPYEGGPAPKSMLPSKKGINRFAWNMKRDGIMGIQKVFVNGNYAGGQVAPGNYKVRLIADKDTLLTECSVIADPRLKVTQAQYIEQEAFTTTIEQNVQEIHESVIRMRKVKKQVDDYLVNLKDILDTKALADSGKVVSQKIAKWEETLISPKQETFQDVINFPNRLNAELLDLKSRMDSHEPHITQGAKARLVELMSEWKILKNALDQLIIYDVANFNNLYKARQLPALIVPK